MALGPIGHPRDIVPSQPPAPARDLPMPNSTHLHPGFMIVHGNRLDDLRSLVVSWMRRYPLAPLENEIALVQSNGIAQWLKLALAEDPLEDDQGGCGIAAAIDVQLPGSFMWQLYRSVLGRSEIPEVSLLDKAPLTWRLMRLLPGMRSGCEARRIAISQGDLLLGVLVLEVLESCPYTTTVRVSQEHCLSWLPVPKMEVRVYHDARMAEVVRAENARRFRGIYHYPNAQMHQPDEKNQLNLFLGEWLGHCLACGHELEPVL